MKNFAEPSGKQHRERLSANSLPSSKQTASVLIHPKYSNFSSIQKLHAQVPRHDSCMLSCEFFNFRICEALMKKWLQDWIVLFKFQMKLFFKLIK